MRAQLHTHTGARKHIQMPAKNTFLDVFKYYFDHQRSAYVERTSKLNLDDSD